MLTVNFVAAQIRSNTSNMLPIPHMYVSIQNNENVLFNMKAK